MTGLSVVVSGVLVGLLQGLVGGGGSVLGAPMLVYFVGFADSHVAIGTSAVAVAVAALFSLLSYLRAGHVKWRCGAAFTAAGLIGALGGSSLGKSFAGPKLMFLFGLLMIAVAATMFFARPAAGDADVRLDRQSAGRLAPWLLFYGAGVGFLSGFFGIGGGFLAVPALARAVGMPLVYAIGTSLISVAAFGLVTAASYAASGFVDWGATATFMAGGIAGGLLGTRLARRIAGRGRWLPRVFAGIVAAIGAFVVFNPR